MKYGSIQSIGLFKVKANNPLRGEEYLDPGKCKPAPLFLPNGDNTYFGWKAYLERDAVLLDGHLKSIASVRQFGGVLNFGLQPDSSTIAAECHQSIIDKKEKLEALFAALEAEADEGFTIVVRYASEMNQRSDKNPYAGDPQAYQAGIKAVIEARDKVAPSVKIAFSPAINAAAGGLNGPSTSSIRPYWPDLDGIDVVSCTLYSRPQNAFYGASEQQVAISRDKTLKTVMQRVNNYFKSNMATGKTLMIDELGGCMRPKAQTAPANANNPPLPPGNDEMLQMMLHRFDLGPNRQIDYATIFLQIEWGIDAKLRFLIDANP